MAYALTNPPVCLFQLHPAGKRMWFYNSPDAASLVRVSNYFTNGAIPAGGYSGLGMKDQDLIWVMDSDTGLTTMHQVMVAAGVVDLTDATTMTTVTSSD